LIVVVAILGVLAAVATPMIMNQVQKAREGADAANARTIENAYKIAMATTDPAPTKPTTLANVVTILGNSLKPIPEPRDDTYDFYLNPDTGEVTMLNAAPASGPTLINLNPSAAASTST